MEGAPQFGALAEAAAGLTHQMQAQLVWMAQALAGRWAALDRRFRRRLNELGYSAAQVASLVGLVTVLEAKDPYTKGHSLRVRDLTVKMAEHLYGVSREAAIAAQLHDIGKVGLTDAVPNEPGKLTDEERATSGSIR